MYVSQSTLSQQIKSLENELGTILFQRDSHSASLTQSGAMLLPLAIQTIQDAEACKVQMNDLKEMLTGELNIGVTYSFSHILTETVNNFVKEYPGVKLNIIYRNMVELMEALRHREVDLVLAFKPDQAYDEIAILKYNDENSLASCITIAYYCARSEYKIIRELPGGYGFADMVFLPKSAMHSVKSTSHTSGRTSPVSMKNLSAD